MRLRLPLMAGLALAAFAMPCRAAPETAPPAETTLAVVDLGFLDTSGEPSDQSAGHAARLRAFSDALRSDLASSGRYRLVAIDCGGSCATDEAGLARTAAAARGAGARFLLIGAIHKMSTLVSWAQVRIFDVETNTVAFDRLLTFRGDTDEAWRRAETFLWKDIAEKGPPIKP